MTINFTVNCVRLLTQYRNMNDVFCAVCPANFTHISFVNGCYKVMNRNLNWNDAALACRALHQDAHLVVIRHAMEQAAVAGLLESIASTSVSVHSAYSFIKLTKQNFRNSI